MSLAIELSDFNVELLLKELPINALFEFGGKVYKTARFGRNGLIISQGVNHTGKDYKHGNSQFINFGSDVVRARKIKEEARESTHIIEKDRYRITSQSGECFCEFCGYPLYIGDYVTEWDGEPFCSAKCAEERGNHLPAIVDPSTLSF